MRSYRYRPIHLGTTSIFDQLVVQVKLLNQGPYLAYLNVRRVKPVVLCTPPVNDIMRDIIGDTCSLGSHALLLRQHERLPGEFEA